MAGVSQGRPAEQGGGEDALPVSVVAIATTTTTYRCLLAKNDVECSAPDLKGRLGVEFPEGRVFLVANTDM